MITWITDTIGTGAYDETAKISPDSTTCVVDVRDLVDKQGNNSSLIARRIEEAVSFLRANKKIIICCDYGISRSNAIAIGVIVKWLDVSFGEAISITQKTIDTSGIKIEMLNTVHNALYPSEHLKKSSSIPKNILITGGNGFIGRRLKDALKTEYEISSPTSKELNLLEDSVALYQLVVSKNIDTIIHLANPRILTTNTSMGETLVMLKNILDICKIYQLKLIYLSSWEIYSGYIDNELAANEETTPNPKGSYGETKWLCELLIKQHAATYGIQHQIIRLSPVYGPGGERPKFIYTFIQKALQNEDIITHQYKNGYPALDLLYVDDAIRALRKAVANNLKGEINIGSGYGISTFDIAKIICDITKSKSTIRHATIQENTPHVIMDITLAHTLLGWEPMHTIQFGLHEMIKKVTV